MLQLLLQRCPELTWRDRQGATALDHCREQLELRAAVTMASELCRRLGDGAQRNDLEAEHGVVDESYDIYIYDICQV